MFIHILTFFFLTKFHNKGTCLESDGDKEEEGYEEEDLQLQSPLTPEDYKDHQFGFDNLATDPDSVFGEGEFPGLAAAAPYQNQHNGDDLGGNYHTQEVFQPAPTGNELRQQGTNMTAKKTTTNSKKKEKASC